MWMDLGEWKLSVSYDRGANIFLAPCLVSYSLGDARSEISEIHAEIQRCGATSRGTIL